MIRHFSFFFFHLYNFFSSRFLNLLFQIFFLLFVNDLFFCLNLLFQQDSLNLFYNCFTILLHLPRIQEYQYRLNIILKDQHDRLNLKSFFHCLQWTTRSCWHDQHDCFNCQHNHQWSTWSFKFKVFFIVQNNYTIVLTWSKWSFTIVDTIN